MIDFTQPTFWAALVVAPLSPFVWIALARAEYRSRFVSRFFESREEACAANMLLILGMNYVRTSVMKLSLETQPVMDFEPEVVLTMRIFCCAATIIGMGLVAFSSLRLGLYGTFLGDYFGILKAAPVTGAPFSWMQHPMYHGSALAYAGMFFFNFQPAGLFLAGMVWLGYMANVASEEQFTAMIYAEAKKDA